MKYLIVSMRDAAAESYLSIHIEQSEATAIRGFENAVRSASADRGDLLYFNPSDFMLFALGSFDSESGVIEPFSVPKLLRKGDEVS